MSQLVEVKVAVCPHLLVEEIVINLKGEQEMLRLCAGLVLPWAILVYMHY